ncbi:MAG: prenyltransferase/squalene oxidase repeat-containing protein, partial [Candidatus Parcubacteria bacterium]|nr:prenyltransferase/squalene oxidase repeat-containing protein [Candidatus Parcubacteria bacterium]
TETFTIRNGNSVIYNGSVSLPAISTVSISDSSNVAHTINARSVLAILKTIDDTSDTFAISDLNYNNSFQSFLLNCITPLSSEPACYNWQYTVNNVYPAVGMDKTILAGGETIYLYFGPQNKVVLSSNNINTNNTLTVNAQKYDYQNNAWLSRTEVTVGLTQPNPNDTFSPIEVQTHPVDANGQATFSGISAGSYNVGIQQDYYFPTESLTVSAAPTGGGGGGGGYTPPTFDAQKALAYLKNAQASDGSFSSSDLYADWAGIAFGAMNVTDNSKDKLLSYFNSHNVISSLLTDNERHAMALLALGQNPYSFNGVNYIEAITNSFDGAQFGDANLVNDDIFALIPLKNSGYTASDNIIIKDIAFIISKQKMNGSWEESADVTAATIQALKSFESITGVANALTKATNYLASAQNNDGGWNNVSSTSWAMQAMSALGASWSKSGRTPINYLALQQMTDGAVFPSSETLQNRIWATSYAIVGASLKPWSAIMQSVPKPEPIPNTVLPKTEPVVNVPVVQIKSQDKSSIKKTPTVLQIQKPVAVAQDFLPNETAPEITPNTLTATAVNSVNALPTQNMPKSVPIVLGAVSGLVLLYFFAKFFIL